MEKVEGITVEDFIGRIEDKAILNYINPMFNTIFIDSLKEITDLGYIPFDLHQGNVMVSDVGLPVIVDFGLFEKMHERNCNDYSSIKKLKSSSGTHSAIKWICNSMNKYIEQSNQQELVQSPLAI